MIHVIPRNTMNDIPCVYILDDDASARNSLRALFESVRLRVETFDSPRAFLDLCGPDLAGCLLLDLRMPLMGGIEVLENLRTRGATLPVIMITGFAEVLTVINAFKEGVFDFVEKPFGDQQIVDAVHRALRKDAAERSDRERRSPVVERVHSLTTRQRDVLSLVVAGESSRSIGERLGLQLTTVEGHRSEILRKMQAKSVADLVRMVSDAGVAPPLPETSGQGAS